MTTMHLLQEFSIGYSLFRVKEFEDTGSMIPQVEKATLDAAKFMSAVKLVAFRPFETAHESLENINAITEGLMTPILEAFLASNGFSQGNDCGVLGVECPTLGQAIKEATGATVQHKSIVPELIRGVRLHLGKFIKGLSNASIMQACLGLGHSYSRSKLKFNVNRIDNNIIQTIALNDQTDKDVNTFAMRLREWYSYHFPELSRLVEDQSQYAQCVKFIGDKATLTDDKLEALTSIVKDDDKAQEIMDAARMSMGSDITEEDLGNIVMFTEKVNSMTFFKKGMCTYLNRTMNNVAPNLGVLIGDQVAARLISNAGSLTNLAKMPASTVQILGAEKALFRALKTKGNTPKYGLLYNSTFIGRAGVSDKGRISRFLANKCSAASRIDCFSDHLTTTFGETLKNQVEDRLKFYATGDIPRKNTEVMAEALKVHLGLSKKLAKASKKRKRESECNKDTITNGVNGHDDTANGHDEAPPKKKSKKDKKKERQSIACLAEVEAKKESQQNKSQEDIEDMDLSQSSPAKSKKKKKKAQRESV